MFDIVRKKIEIVRQANETTKKRWIFAMTVISAVFIVGLWFYWSGGLIPSPAQETESSQTGFWEIFKNGISVTYDSLKKDLQDLFFRMNKEIELNIEK